MKETLVGKWWSILFAVVMLGCALSMVVAPLVGIWLPEGVSTHAWDVDKLFYFILAVTTFFFLLTEGLLVWFMWKYAGRYDPAKAKEVLEADLATQPPEPMETLQPTWFGRLMRPVLRVLNDQHRVEMAWTLVPAIILLYIAFAQVGAWVEIKYRSRMPNRELDEASLRESLELPTDHFARRADFLGQSLVRYRHAGHRAGAFEQRGRNARIDAREGDRLQQFRNILQPRAETREDEAAKDFGNAHQRIETGGRDHDQRNPRLGDALRRVVEAGHQAQRRLHADLVARHAVEGQRATALRIDADADRPREHHRKARAGRPRREQAAT